MKSLIVLITMILFPALAFAGAVTRHEHRIAEAQAVFVKESARGDPKAQQHFDRSVARADRQLAGH